MRELRHLLIFEPPPVVPDASLVLAADAPSISIAAAPLVPSVASLVLSGSTLFVDPVHIPSASLVLAGIAPTASGDTEAKPGSASLLLSEDGPSVAARINITVPSGSFVFSENAPQVDYRITLYEVDCIEPSKGQPVVRFSRVDPAQLPREIEIQFVDAAQNYAMITQSARHLQARIKDGLQERHASTTATMKSTAAIDFLITGVEGRTMAFDLLYRAWTEAVSLQFIHPDLRLEAGDTFQMNGRFGSVIGRIDEQTWTKQRTNQISATLLAPVGPNMGTDDTSPQPPNAVTMRTFIGIGIWGGLGAYGTTIPADGSATCCAPPESQGLQLQGVSTHIRLKKKASNAPAVEFLAGAD